jgi:hypothetical protein
MNRGKRRNIEEERGWVEERDRVIKKDDERFHLRCSLLLPFNSFN